MRFVFFYCWIEESSSATNGQWCFCFGHQWPITSLQPSSSTNGDERLKPLRYRRVEVFVLNRSTQFLLGPRLGNLSECVSYESHVFLWLIRIEVLVQDGAFSGMEFISRFHPHLSSTQYHFKGIIYFISKSDEYRQRIA